MAGCVIPAKMFPCLTSTKSSFTGVTMPITKVVPGTTRLGWIGTGVMGQSMCSHLIAQGFAVTVYNRSRGKAQSLLDRGAAWGNSPREVAQKSDVIFAIVGFPRDVSEVFLGADGALAGSKALGDQM